MFWSSAPWPKEGSGQCYIPEIIDIDFNESPDDDEFVKLLIEVMSKPMKGGHHG
jgi:hypothetical protein